MDLFIYQVHREGVLVVPAFVDNICEEPYTVDVKDNCKYATFVSPNSCK